MASVGSVNVLASKSATIKATSFAAAVSFSIGGETGVSVAGGGSTAENLINATTSAYISNSTLKSVGAVAVDATDASVIDATVASIAASVALGGSNGVGVVIGVPTPITGSATARNGNRLVGLPSGKLDQRQRPRRCQRSGPETINATTEAAAVSLAGGGDSGVAISGAGVGDINQSNVAIQANVSGGSIDSGGLIVAASDKSSIEAFAGAAALSGAIGGSGGVAVSVGISIAENSIVDPVSAMSRGSPR